MITAPEYKLMRWVSTLNSLTNSGMVTAPKYHSEKESPKTKQKRDSLSQGGIKSEEENLILSLLNFVLSLLLRALLGCNSFIMQKQILPRALCAACSASMAVPTLKAVTVLAPSAENQTQFENTCEEVPK